MQLIISSLKKVIEIFHAECHGMKEKDGLEWRLAESFTNTEIKNTSDTEHSGPTFMSICGTRRLFAVLCEF